MSLDLSMASGRKHKLDGDNKIGLITQDPTHTKSAGTWTTSGDAQYGAVQQSSILLTAAADGTVNAAIFNKDCPHKIRILDATIFPRTLRTGGTPDHKVRLFKGDGAASEAFTAITDDKDCDVAADTQTKFTTFDDAQTIIEADKSLRATLVVGGTTTTGTALFEVIVLWTRVKA